MLFKHGKILKKDTLSLGVIMVHSTKKEMMISLLSGERVSYHLYYIVNKKKMSGLSGSMS